MTVHTLCPFVSSISSHRMQSNSGSFVRCTFDTFPTVRVVKNMYQYPINGYWVLTTEDWWLAHGNHGSMARMARMVYVHTVQSTIYTSRQNPVLVAMSMARNRVGA